MTEKAAPTDIEEPIEQGTRPSRKAKKTEVTDESLDNNDQNDNHVRYKTNEELIISDATIEYLFVQLADKKYQDSTFLNTFLLSADYFLEPSELLEMLVCRYKEVVQSGKKLHTCIQLRLINVIKKWIHLQYPLLRGRKRFNDGLKGFFNYLLNNGVEAEKHWAEAITFYVGNHEKSYNEAKKKRLIMPKPTRPTTQNILEIDPKKLAAHMTLIDYSLFQASGLKPYHHRGWTQKDKHKVKVKKILERFALIKYWIITTIVNATDNSIRAHILAKFLALLGHLLDFQNYNGLMQVYLALSQVSVQRLKRTWKHMSKKNLANYEKVRNLMSKKDCYKLYHEALYNANPPCIPYQRVLLADLADIEKKENFFEREGLTFVNWDKMTGLATIFGQILKCQRITYCDIEENIDGDILDFIGNIASYEVIESSKENWLTMSQQCESYDVEGNPSTKKGNSLLRISESIARSTSMITNKFH